MKINQIPGQKPAFPAPIQGIVAIDQGTHASRAIFYDLYGTALFSAEKKVSLNRLNDQCVEQDPREILDSVREVLREILTAIQQPSKDQYQACYIGLATQRSSLVAWDKNQNPLCPVLSWQDRRAVQELEPLRPYEPFIKEKTGLPLSPHYGASKFRWLLEHNPEVKKASKENNLYFGPLVSYLLYCLLDEPRFIVDHANASRTLLWSLKTGTWDDDLLKLFNLKKDHLPHCLPVLNSYGTINKVPVMAVSGDQNAAVYSEGAPDTQNALINLGSGAFVLKPTAKKLVLHKQLLSGLSCSSDNEISYTLEGTVNGAATALEWAFLQCKTGPEQDLNDILLSCEEPLVFINTVGGLGSPFWKSGPAPYWIDADTADTAIHSPEDSRAAIAGVLESVIFLLKVNIDEILKSGQKIDTLFVSGGLSQADALCQRLADVNQIRVVRLNSPEATSRGIAFLAAGMPKTWEKTPGQVFQPETKINKKLIYRYNQFLNIISGL